jgi:hypothetical protein
MISIKKLMVNLKDRATMVTRKGITRDFFISGVCVSKHSGKAYNIEIEMDTQNLQPDTKVRVACSCPDFKFRWAYVLHKQGALLHPSNFILTPPKITNPNEIEATCKHLHIFAMNELNNELKNFSVVKDRI